MAQYWAGSRWPVDPLNQRGLRAWTEADKREVVSYAGFEVGKLVIVTNASLKTHECIGCVKSIGDGVAEVTILGTGSEEFTQKSGRMVRSIHCSMLVDLTYKLSNITILNLDLMDAEAILECLKKADTIFENRKDEEKMAMANCCCEKKPLTGYKKVAGVTLGTAPYYYAVYDEDIEVGSLVMVTGRASGQVLTVESLVSVDDYDGSHTITEEVCAIVDNTLYLDRQSRREKAAKLMKKMDAEIAKMTELDKYARYAEINPGVADLFKELKELGV